MLFAGYIPGERQLTFPELSKFSTQNVAFEVLSEDKTTPGSFYRGLFWIIS
jgi:hypothetical protein